jgi:integrase
MSWDSKQARWVKMHKGERYTVSCSALGVPPTKEGSYQAANAWWTIKRAEIDAVSKPARRVPLPLEDVAAASLGAAPDGFGDVRRMLESALLREESDRKAGKPVEGIGSVGSGAIAIGDEPVDADAIRRHEVMRLVERLLFGDGKLPDAARSQLPPARALQLEQGAALVRGDAVADPARTVGAMANAWHQLHRARVEAGDLAPDRCKNVAGHLRHFVQFVGEQADVAAIDAAVLQSFHLHCLGEVSARRQSLKAGWSVAYARETFSVARSWMRWLAEQGTIEPPKNINSKQFKFGSTAKTIPTWTIDEVQYVISEAPGKLKLAMLLMVNCGMTQIDVSDLRDSEVNWTTGRITRRRSKTAGIESVPTVSYPLWGDTFALLKKYRSGAARVLLTESGLPYVRKEWAGGKLVKADGFTSNYAHLKRRLCFTKPMKLLRKTSASLLESHEVYGRFTGMFLGHAPATMREKHYAAPPQNLFDEAIHWLGRECGLAG